MSGPPLTTSTSPVTVVWFRRDLRVDDNLALAAGALAGAVVPLFVWSPEEEGQFYPGRASRWWLKKSLKHLAATLQAMGAPLILRRSRSTLAVLMEVMTLTGATQLFFNHLYDPVSLVRDDQVKKALRRRGFSVRSFNGDLLHEPWEMAQVLGRESRSRNSLTFATFFQHWSSLPATSPIEAPATLLSPFSATSLKNEPVESLGLESPEEKDSNSLLSRAWLPGCGNAQRSEISFLYGGPLLYYSGSRGKAGHGSTSLLSPHLHFGELSIRRLCENTLSVNKEWERDGQPSSSASTSYFLRSLALREYSRFLIFQFPFTHNSSLMQHLCNFPWSVDETLFKAWCQGRTGYPLVDAGMRELWATGWIHNRIRVITASFCVKYLQLPWQWGMKYYWDTLLDSDLEEDVLGWQYVSGSLPDGHEVDRMDDPEEWGICVDPDGEYIRRWLPELSRLPTRWIYRPGEAPPEVLRAAGVELGCTYPRPLVDVATARHRLQSAIQIMSHKEAARKAAMASGKEEGEGECIPQARMLSDRAVHAHQQEANPPLLFSNPTQRKPPQSPDAPDVTAASAVGAQHGMVSAHFARQMSVNVKMVPSKETRREAAIILKTPCNSYVDPEELYKILDTLSDNMEMPMCEETCSRVAEGAEKSTDMVGQGQSGRNTKPVTPQLGEEMPVFNSRCEAWVDVKHKGEGTKDPPFDFNLFPSALPLAAAAEEVGKSSSLVHVMLKEGREVSQDMGGLHPLFARAGVKFARPKS